MPFTRSLFDRFGAGSSEGIDSLARDVADLLGGRRTQAERGLGVISWGMAGTSGVAPSREEDRRRMAARIAETLRLFEPRLTGVRVTPLEDTSEFSFDLVANLAGSEHESVALRIVCPRRGGALGADVTVLDHSIAVVEDEERGNR